MSLSSQYKAQFEWRDWSQILNSLPAFDQPVVLDLGCGVGDLAAELVNRGGRVIGFDFNEELLHEARSRQLTRAEFRLHDLREPLGCSDADGIWCSFAAAYFCDLSTVLQNWAQSLKVGGWIALTEVDDMFGHVPISEHTRKILKSFAKETLSDGLYDFHMGRKLKNHVAGAGFSISQAFTVEDQELSFNGPAAAEVVQAWRDRFERMPLLRKFCGSDFLRVQDEFLGCLASADHSSVTKVHCVIATK